MRRRLTRDMVAKEVGGSELLTWLADAGCIPHGRAAGPIRWQAVFFIGPAASGKSYHKEKRYLRHLDFKDIDPDKIKMTHPDYDPERPFKLHGWSKQVADAEYKRLVTDGTGSPVIVDGTGRDYVKIADKMRLANENGYRTFLVYIYVPFEISIYRNRNRGRFVPEEVVEEQSKRISDSYRKLRSIADKSKVIIGYDKSELPKAERDIELYPVPQKERPPRPGDPDYGMPVEASDARLHVAGAMVALASRLIEV